uniref:Activin_recp domain-containing protein n=1 Tax=Globodera pallida TaxID=36090 RepID=A0A183BI65_GLOPA
MLESRAKSRFRVSGNFGSLLTCKKGYLDSEEYGGAYQEECSQDEDQYCYMASCAKGNEYVRTVWDCSPNTNCTAISAKVGETVNSAVNCECRFGKANASLANENFTFPILPMMNTNKPTTTTNKPTTTTNKPTTTTNKPTTTTNKPTTTTDKPTTTTDKPTNTTAEANLGVRAIIPVGSGVLLAIAGHVLASVLPKLGVGNQLFNDL